jgi:hypothetical protein
LESSGTDGHTLDLSSTLTIWAASSIYNGVYSKSPSLYSLFLKNHSYIPP